MRHTLVSLAVLLQILHFTVADESNRYCYYNITIRVNVKVNKTREVKVQKPWYKKLGKPSTTIEHYEEDEMVPQTKTVRGCCKGYNINGMNMCDPVCLEGCPDKSKCVEPETCKCIEGYYSTLSEHNRKHYCAPICTEPCPEHSTCIAPNKCACAAGYKLTDNKQCQPQCPSGCRFGGTCIAANQCSCTEGYRAERGTCVPNCSLGDGCKNGECIGVETCICNIGYTLNKNNNKCEPSLAIFQDDESSEVATTEIEYTTEMHWDLDSNTFKVNEDEASSDPSESSAGIVATVKCPADYVLLRGQCQPLKFNLDEIDCREAPCADPHSHCSGNGTCACDEGYRWFKELMPSNGTDPTETRIKPVCVTLGEPYKGGMRKEDLEKSQSTVEDSTNFTSIIFIVLGVVVMSSALVYLGFRLLRTNRGQMDVENKNFACTYENRSATDPEKSTI